MHDLKARHLQAPLVFAKPFLPASVQQLGDPDDELQVGIIAS
jgi:hypothetical protein